MACMSWLLVLVAIVVPAAFGLTSYRCDEPDTPAIKSTCLLKGVHLTSGEAVANASFPNDERYVALTMVDGWIPEFSRLLALKLPTVQELTVRGMGIERFYVGPTLEQLMASNNTIRAVEFAHEPHRLRTLRLEHNQLTGVPQFGRWFNELRYLSLDDNRLERVSLDAFAGLEQLQSLSLARNALIAVDQQPVLLPHLKHLSLAANHLLTVNTTGWEMPSLVSLDLSGNDLYLLLDGTKQFARFGALQELAYTGNDWNCEWLSETQQTLRQRSIKTIDHERAGRCDREQMMTLHGVCCYEHVHNEPEEDTTLDALVRKRWEQLNALRGRYELVQFAYELVRDADLTRIADRSHELRTRLAGPVADGEATIGNELGRLRLALANATAHLERMEERIERTVLDLNQTIAELVERAARPKPTLDAVHQQTFRATVEHLERLVDRLKERLQAYVYAMDKRERGLRQLGELIGQREEQLRAAKKELRAIEDDIGEKEARVYQAYGVIEDSLMPYPDPEPYGRLRAPPQPSGYQRQRG
uniref:Leucine rich immune protein (Short) n=1 Tax=Anopheles farauti TaxID=69004 RepID=A0A182QQT9_9DIPT